MKSLHKFYDTEGWQDNGQQMIRKAHLSYQYRQAKKWPIICYNI